MPAISLIGVLLAVVFLGMALYREFISTAIVYEYQKGLLYKSGKFSQVLEPGRYKISKKNDHINIIDMRSLVLHVPNQEVVLSDNIPVKISIAGIYRVVDAAKVTHSARNFMENLHLMAQMALRQLVAEETIDSFVPKRNAISQQLLEQMKPAAAQLGIELESCGIRDITYSPEVKKIYSHILKAEKTGVANLAASRAELASLRALNNAAKMIEASPALLSLRTLQSMNELAASSGNTIVFGMPPLGVPVAATGKTESVAQSEAE